MHKHQHISIDSYAYHSEMADWNPSFQAAFAVAAMILVISFDRVSVSLMTFLFMSGMTTVIGKIRKKDYIRLLNIPAVFILLAGVAILLQFGENGTGKMQVYVSRQSVQLTVHVVLKAFAAISALFMLTLSTPMSEIIAVLRRIHVPAIILELMYLIYRYIFILADTNRHQREASTSRLGYVDFRTSLHTFGSEMANLLVMSMKRAQEYYDAMESRGYDGSVLFWEEDHPLQRRQIQCALGYVGMLILMLLLPGGY